MSEPSDEQAAMQHYLVCGTEDCQENGQFYCNACHRPLCEQCRDQHQKSPNTKNHEIVLYRHRKQQLPVEICQDHPTRNKELFCRECSIPICSKCSTMKEHKGHAIDDLEEIYADKYAVRQGEFSKIQKYFLPTTEDLKSDIEEDVIEIKKIMKSFRASIKAEAESLKKLVDEVTSESIENTHSMEKSLLKMLKSQETTYDDYITYLWKMSDEFQEYLSISNQKFLFTKTTRIQPIPETTKPVPPVFTAGRFSKNDVTKLLGRLWVSDHKGNLVQTDLQGNLLQKIKTNVGFEGFHTATQDGDLIYTDKDKKVIYKITPDRKITEFIKPGHWKPRSVHSSCINGDILVGMEINVEAKVTRYSKTGKEIQNIQRDNQGQELYTYPNYITENINGDICTSDFRKRSIVVVNKSGNHRFSYTGQGSRFCPCGICTDILGHILMCDSFSDTVHLLDQDGGFLSVIFSPQQGIKRPRGVCVDVENNLYVGQDRTNIVTVYKYLQ
uniref:E3 ubiquitin-protein ligase TRIM71-like isoform X2 n=1 Tax=Crassostrea virginica TaxID=6565 RepID=A0A8B8B214_CRAVI|nr:E3 ubiquitin-protein ligase TRIM71-like isoform X2 [Crassostrea virginica]